MTIDDRHEPPSPHELRAEGRIVIRLEQLERDNRRLRRYTTLMLVVVAMVLGLGTALLWYSVRSGLPGSPQTVSARQFVLRDGQGRVRGAWGLDDSGAVRLTLSDEGERQRNPEVRHVHRQAEDLERTRLPAVEMLLEPQGRKRAG